MVHHRLRNSDVVLSFTIYSFLRLNVISTFRNTGKLIPFALKEEQISLKMRSKVGQPTTVCEFEK